jgi:parallel beta-helix repeat protein
MPQNPTLVGGEPNHPAAHNGLRIYRVAPNTASAAVKEAADWVCDGTADDVEIQGAIDSLSSNGGEIVLLPGTFDIAATIKVRVEQVSIRFTPGALVRWTTVTGRTPLIQMLISNTFLYHPRLQGSGTKGNGIGVQIGGQASTEPIVGADQPGGVHVHNARLSSLDTGLEFGIQSDGTQSVGDCVMWGGRIQNCKVGVRSAGFVNYVYGPFISTCDIGVQQTADRGSGKIVVNGATINQWASAAIEVLNGRGSVFDNIWAEHTATQSAVPTECIRIAPTGSDRVRNLTFGYLHIHPIDVADGTPELYGLRLSGNVEGMVAHHLEFTDELPSTALIRQDSTHTGTRNIVHKLSFGDTIPSTWTHAMLVSNASTTGRVVVEDAPGPAGSASGVTVGAQTPLPVGATYYVDKSGSPNAATYWAKNQYGHVAAVYADTSTTSGLKALLEGLAADDVIYRFGTGRYHFLDAPVGNEAWAGSQDHVGFGSSTPPLTGIGLFGAGMRSTIISNRTNWTGSGDTEPLSFINCQYVTIRDLTVECCGVFDSTTDAIDLDQGSYCLVERVRVSRSRSRAIIFDGGDAGKNATGNVIRQCFIQGRPDKPNLTLVSGGTLTASTTFRYLVSWVDSDLGGAQVSGETKPSEEARITTTTTSLSVRVDVPIGPYTTTARKIYRAPAGSASWVLLTTINDNTTETYTDTGGAGSGVTMPVSFSSTIESSGIELLGASGNVVEGCTVDGAGGTQSGATKFGINLVRKGSGSATVNSDRNRVTNNTVRQTSDHGIRLLGANDNVVSHNTVINPGRTSTQAQAIRVDGVAAATTNNNQIHSNRCLDDQDANSWSTGKTMNNVITITATESPTGNVIADNLLTAGSSSTVISDSGAASAIRNNKGHNPQGPASITVGASPFTYSAGPTPETVYVSGGTVSSITKGGTALGITAGSIGLEPNEAIVVTYSTPTPTMVKDRH